MVQYLLASCRNLFSTERRGIESALSPVHFEVCRIQSRNDTPRTGGGGVVDACVSAPLPSCSLLALAARSLDFNRSSHNSLDCREQQLFDPRLGIPSPIARSPEQESRSESTYSFWTEYYIWVRV
jgi:hypothetical protein